MKLATGIVPGIVALSCVVLSPAHAEAVKAQPNGFDEVPTLSTPATSAFRAHINNDATEIEYELTYSDFLTPVTQAHLHFGKKGINGGIMVFLCTNLNNAPAGTPACPANAGTVTGLLRATDVVGPAAQGIAAGEFAEVVAAIRAGAAYANIHTQAFPAGEIRDQLDARGSRGGK